MRHRRRRLQRQRRLARGRWWIRYDAACSEVAALGRDLFGIDAYPGTPLFADPPFGLWKGVL